MSGSAPVRQPREGKFGACYLDRVIRIPAPIAIVPVVVMVISGGLAGCRRPPVDPGSRPAATTTGRLTAEDVGFFLAVRAQALSNLEAALSEVERAPSVDVRARVEELSSAERAAVERSGRDWRRYAEIRDRVAQAFTDQRQAADRERMSSELEQTRADLVAQRARARDAQTSAFLDHQIAALETELAKLRGAQLARGGGNEHEVLVAARGELERLQVRHDAIQHRLAALLNRVLTPRPVGPTPRSGQ